MFLPNEQERKVCCDIVKEILIDTDDATCQKYADEILSISYSIGGDYSKSILQSIATAFFEKIDKNEL